MRNRSRYFLLALLFSLLVHGLFVASSRQIHMSSYAEAAQRVHKVFFREETEPEARRPQVKPQNVERRARQNIEELADMLPQIPDTPPIVPENIVDDRPEAPPEEPHLFDRGMSAPVQPMREDFLENLYDSLPEKVIETSRNTGKDVIEGEPISIDAAAGGLAGGPGGLVVPDVSAGEKIYIPAPEPVGSIGGDFPSLEPPEPPRMDLASVEPPPLPPPPMEISPEPLPVEDQQPKPPALDPFLSVVLDTYHDPSGQGFFRITIRPNEASNRLRALPKDVIFVIDASSSMGKPRFFRLCEAVKECLDTLNPADRFTVVGFKRETIFFSDSLIPANEQNVRSAKGFIDDLESSGRTDIYRSLASTLARRPSRNRPYIVLLFSDGVPTAGRTDARQIIIDLTSQNQGGATIFSFGTASDPRRLNKYFLDMLSYLNRGFVDFRFDYDEIEPAVESMYRRIDDPLLIDIRGDYGVIDRNRIYPSVLPDLFRDGEISIYGQYSNEKEFFFRLEGTGPEGQMMDFVYRQPLPGQDTAGPEIARQWAFQKIYSMIGEMCLAGESEAGMAMVRSLSEKYSIQTPYYNHDM